MTLEQAQAGAAELQQQSEMAAILARLQEQEQLIAELKAAAENEGTGDLDFAIREFSKGRVQQTQWTSGQCRALTKSGALCGRLLDDHLAPDVGTPARVRDHTFRLTPFVHIEVRKPRNHYSRDDVVQAAAEPDAVEDTYYTERDAAARLGVTVPALRKLVKDGQVKADRVGSVVLVRRVSVDRIVALAELSEEPDSE